MLPFMHSRTCMSVLGNVFNWVSDLPDHKLEVLPPYIVDELLCACLFHPYAYTNIGSSLSNIISATDSSGAQAGSCIAEVSPGIARVLHRRFEHKGDHGRLDWNAMQAALSPYKMIAPDQALNELFKSLPWIAPRSYAHEGLHHINIQELRAIFDESERRAWEVGERDVRIVVATDSRVTLGAIGKGRSSSRNMNTWLRNSESCPGAAV